MSTNEITNSNRNTAIVVGVLFIIGTAAGILSQLLLGSILNGSDYLFAVSANENRVIAAALTDLIMVVAIGSIPVMLYSVLKKHHNEKTALGYAVARIFEAVPIIFGAISLLLLLTLSWEYNQAGAADASYFQTFGAVLLGAREWTDLIGTQIFFGLTALILNYSFYKTKLVPRFISVWGLIGAALILVAGLLGLFGLLGYLSPIAIILSFPIALNEMVLAVWLIVKGFNSSAIMLKV